GQVFFGLPSTTLVDGEPVRLVVRGAFPFPGGFVLGGLLMANLVAAHMVRFKVTWKRSGILLIHAGIGLLLVNELTTYLFAKEGNMTITEGDTVNFVEHIRRSELAIISPSAEDKNSDHVTVVPSSILQRSARKKETISNAELPFDIEVEKYFVNSRLRALKEGANDPDVKGAAEMNEAVERAEVAGADATQSVELPSVMVRLK